MLQDSCCPITSLAFLLKLPPYAAMRGLSVGDMRGQKETVKGVKLSEVAADPKRREALYLSGAEVLHCLPFIFPVNICGLVSKGVTEERLENGQPVA